MTPAGHPSGVPTNRNRRILFIAVGSLVLLAVAVALGVFRHPGLTPQWVNDLPPYDEELRATTRGEIERPDPHPPGAPAYTGPGQLPRWSPDVTLLAVDTVDDFLHTVEVWNPQTGARTPVITITEADPGSGRSHWYSWSADSRALFIYGSGWLPGDRSHRTLCLAYFHAERKLYQLPGCHPG